MAEALLKSFISLFVAIDALGALPLLIGLTRGMGERERKVLVYKATLAALLIGLIFLFGGHSIFRFLGIWEEDFRIAGGLLLLVFSIRDLMDASSHQGSPAPRKAGIVPLALPIIMGPAALASLMLSGEQYGYGITVCGFGANLLFVLLLFSRADWVLRWLGDDTSDAFAKISSLLLAAIGVMLVRSGLMAMLALGHGTAGF
jgi:multiple antibiotic resistance protein